MSHRVEVLYISERKDSRGKLFTYKLCGSGSNLYVGSIRMTAFGPISSALIFDFFSLQKGKYNTMRFLCIYIHQKKYDSLDI